MVQVDQIDHYVGEIIRHREYRIKLRRIVATIVREAYWEGFHVRDQNVHDTVLLNSINGKKASKWEVNSEKAKRKKFRQLDLNNRVCSLSLRELEDISFKAESQLFFKKIDHKGGEKVWDTQRT
jgi:hypothetical protein